MIKKLKPSSLNKNKFRYIYQFRISLDDITPPIWRQIQIPENFTFWDFHIAIQDAMGWLDYHLHDFKTTNPKTGIHELIGIPDYMFDERYEIETIAGWSLLVCDYLSEDRKEFKYVYDYGDDWNHTIIFEKILFRSPKVKYPRCIAGERNSPPEDCGGVWGYSNFLKIVADSKHPQHKEMIQWAGKKKCQTELFEPTKVKFDDPIKRWYNAFERD